MEPSAKYVENDEIDLQKLFHVFWRGKYIIAAFAVVFATFGFYYAYFVAKPSYSSYSVVMLNNQSETVIDLPSVLSTLTNDETVVQSEIQVMRSRILVGDVVDKLDLMSDPEFNGALREASLLEKIKGAVRSAILPSRSKSAGATTDPKVLERDRVVDAVLNSYSVSVLPNTTAFKIVANSDSPEKAALLADTIAQQYIKGQIDVKRDATVQAVNWLTDQVGELRVSLENAENAVKQFKTETPMISPEVLTGLERQLKSVRDRISENERRASEAAALQKLLQSDASYEDKATGAGDAVLTELASRAGNNPQAARQFEARAQILIRQARDAEVRANAQLSTLSSSETALEARVRRESSASVELEQLMREAEANRTLYEYFLARLKETSAQQGIQQPDSRIISYAVVPSQPAKPNKKLIVLLSGFLGFAAGAGFVLLMEMRHRTFRSSQEIEDATGISVIGQVPLIEGAGRRDIINYLRDNPTSPVTEAIRNLRTSIMLANIDHPPQIIMTTSAIPGEGKTTIGAALAMNFVGMGKNILLIEGDLRRLSLNQYFRKQQSKAGLISVLTGQVPLAEAVWHSDDLGFDVLFGEKSESNAADIMSSVKMKAMLDDARNHYDVIIIDTPPTLIVPDARVVSQYVDAVLFVVKWDSTHQQQVEEALRYIDGKVMGGIVLNQISPRGFRRYGYNYGYGYGYAAHYDDKYYHNT